MLLAGAVCIVGLIEPLMTMLVIVFGILPFDTMTKIIRRVVNPETVPILAAAHVAVFVAVVAFPALPIKVRTGGPGRPDDAGIPGPGNIRPPESCAWPTVKWNRHAKAISCAARNRFIAQP